MPNLSLIHVCECRMGEQGVPVWHQWRNMIADMTSFFLVFLKMCTLSVLLVLSHNISAYLIVA